MDTAPVANNATGTATFGGDNDEWVAGTIAIAPQSVLLAEHAAGQQTNAFIGSSPVTGVQLFGFKLTNNSTGSLTVDQVVFQLSSVTGIIEGDFTESELKIYEDTNGDGAIKGESTTVGGTGDVNAGVTTITFGTDFNIPASTTVNYIPKGDLSNLVADDTVTIDLGPSNVILTPSGTVGGSAATSVTHTVDCGNGLYSYQRSIVIDYTEVGTDNSGTLPATGFPVLVSLSGDWLKTTSVDAANGADYIVITHRNLGWDADGNAYAWLTDLLALRQAQGHRVMAVDLTDRAGFIGRQRQRRQQRGLGRRRLDQLPGIPQLHGAR